MENQDLTTTELKDGERLDDLERNGFKIIQNPGVFCFGMDAVLLSGFAKVKAGGTAVDLGTGNGIIPILLTAKNELKEIHGLEIQEYSADMAERSVALNGLSDRIKIIRGDIKDVKALLPSAALDVVT
ncbi:MAG: methyltransferase, partial [Lachnospiraceae bacterium]|nr:methyltransferase [Lachnospiraceae bacterium]